MSYRLPAHKASLESVLTSTTQSIMNRSDGYNPPFKLVKWMEEARLDLMDQIGLNYRQMEDMEIISPVLSISVEYHSMVHFDDTVVIYTKLLKYNGSRWSLSMS